MQNKILRGHFLVVEDSSDLKRLLNLCGVHADTLRSINLATGLVSFSQQSVAVGLIMAHLSTKYISNSVGPQSTVHPFGLSVFGNKVDVCNLALLRVYAEYIHGLSELLGLEYNALKDLKKAGKKADDVYSVRNILWRSRQQLVQRKMPEHSDSPGSTG